MPPPSGATLTRAATVAYRRPVNCLAPGGRSQASRHRHATSDASPAYGKTRVVVVDEYSRHSSASVESGLGYGGYGGRTHGNDDDDGDDDGEDDDNDHGNDDHDDNDDNDYDENDCDNHIEVIEDVEEPLQYRERRRPSRDEYIDSSSGTRYHGRRRRPHADEHHGHESRRHYAASDGESAAYASSRTLDHSVESHQERHRHRADVIEDSRPPVSSRRSLAPKHHTSTDAVPTTPHRSRRSSTLRVNRARAGSASGGPSRILGAMFGVSLGRHESVKQSGEVKKRVPCSTCLGDTNPAKLSKLKCGHSMCRTCLRRIFNLSVTDPQHMPPRCCQDDISLKHVDRLFDHAFKKTWNRKFAEYSTKNRVYCPSRKCGEWIKPANIRREHGRKVARCSRCSTKVCCSCNGPWHGAQACLNDAETADILAQAKEEGWKRCFKCKALVELKEGCNHMTCNELYKTAVDLPYSYSRCGAEFCMICGVKWKKCDCPWFNPEDSAEGDYCDDIADIPIPGIRGDLGDIFHGDGPPAPPELRGHAEFGHTTVMPIRHRPRTYQEEMHMRREQEVRDAELARRLQYDANRYDDIRTMGGVGDIHGIGNASPHYMNETYRRGGSSGRPFLSAQAQAQAQYDTPDFGNGFRSRGREGRPAGRTSDSRSGRSSSTAAGPIYPVGMMPPAPAPPPPPPLVAAPPQGRSGRPPRPPRPRRPSRHHSLEADMYHDSPYSPYSPRSEHVVGAQMSRDYEREAELYSPPRSRSRRHGHDSVDGGAKGSHLAGLSGTGSGKNRVSQWRTYVEPGVPDGESTIGHA
ncbi:hypothetical protein E4U53_006130 [Claviceps sorghi]|nr:hypothetical protein E4U53_006130 [Claviceps sorghi]